MQGTQATLLGQPRSLAGPGQEFFSELHVISLHESLVPGACHCSGRLHQKEPPLDEMEELAFPVP